MDQIRGSLSESCAVTSRQSLTKPDVNTLATEIHCGPAIVCRPGEIQCFPSAFYELSGCVAVHVYEHVSV